MVTTACIDSIRWEASMTCCGAFVPCCECSASSLPFPSVRRENANASELPRFPLICIMSTLPAARNILGTTTDCLQSMLWTIFVPCCDKFAAGCFRKSNSRFFNLFYKLYEKALINFRALPWFLWQHSNSALLELVLLPFESHATILTRSVKMLYLETELIGKEKIDTLRRWSEFINFLAKIILSGLRTKAFVLKLSLQPGQSRKSTKKHGKNSHWYFSLKWIL